MAELASQAPLDHHYVPQFLLHQWTTDGKLYRFQQPVAGKVVDHRKPTRAVGFQERLYEIPGFPPELAQQLESGFLRSLDTTAAEAHKLILAKDFASLDATHRSAWTRFLLSLTLRTPTSLAAYKAGFSAVFDAPTPEIQAKYQAQKAEHDPPTAEEFLALHNPGAAVTAALTQLPAVMQNRGLGQFIINMKWSVLEVRSGEFLLSDDALIMSNGIGKSDGHIALPISPRLLFLATNNKATHDTIVQMGDRGVIRTVNELVVGRARHFVAARDMSQKRFIENRFGTKPQTTIAELFAEKYGTTDLNTLIDK